MLKTFSFTYSEHNVIPPHCRKPRTVRGLQGETTVEIREVAAADLQVAGKRVDNGKDITLYYFYDGNLWLPLSAYDTQYFNRYNPAQSYYDAATLPESEEYARRWASNHLICEGKVYAKTQEPCHRVDRYEGKVFIGHDTYSISNALQRGIFPANQFDEALAYAVSLGVKEIRIQSRFAFFLREALHVLDYPEVEEHRQKQIGSAQMRIDILKDEITEFEAEIARLQKAGRYE